MKKFFLLLSLCLLLLALSACGGAKKAGQEEQGQPFSGSVEDLLKLGKNSRCVLNVNSDATITTGTTYISGKRARSDYEMKGPDGQGIKGHYISDGTWMYTWTEGPAAQAMKMKMDEISETSGEVEGSASVSDYQEMMDYKCYNWAVDQSLFELPSGVNFVDYTDLLNRFQNLGQDLNPAQPGAANDALCSQCDKVGNAEIQAQCRQSLNCK